MNIVGMDVSKDKIDAAIVAASAHRSFGTSEQEQQQMLAWLDEHEVEKAVMEATGGYERRWAKLLQGSGIEVRIVDPRRVRHYAQAAGQQAKNDRLDAELIALFGEAFADEPSPLQDEDAGELDQLVSARARLKAMAWQLAAWTEHTPPAEIAEAYQAVASLLEQQVKRLDRIIAGKIDQTERFAERASIIESVPGLGSGSAAGLIAWLPELGLVDNKAIAALVGVAPYANDSGKHHGPRSIRGGRAKLRELLYLPTVGAATRHNPVIKAYYQRMIDNGKPPKVALIACMRKLIVILNTMITRGEKWDPTKHTSP
jgi:transposase